MCFSAPKSVTKRNKLLPDRFVVTVSKLFARPLRQPRLGTGPLAVHRARTDSQIGRHLLICQAAEKFQDNNARLFRILPLKALQGFVDQ